MRRIGTSLVMLAVATLALAATGAGGGESERYLVRAAFDNGNFVVPGEDVRIAGARVGEVVSVDVSGVDEIVSERPSPHPEPGKAILVLEIADPAFHDFRRDGSCVIRPQSLLGEKYIDCQPTRPRAPGSPPAPPLEPIPDGEAGEGQRLLPLERNGRTVDLDLVQNIMRRPYRERFSIILNELGAGVAARGDDLAAVIERANPALRETDRVLAILAEQDAVLRRLAEDSEQVLAPLAREREHVAGFIANAGQTAQAAAERRADLELGIARLPAALRELRATMRELRGFSDQAAPAVADLGEAAPALTGATDGLGPLAEAATPALTSLGRAAEQAGPDIRASDPVIRDVRDLVDESQRPARDVARLLRSLRESGGYDELLGFLFNLSGAVNGFDRYGHVIRTQLLVTNCTDYVVRPGSGCSSNFVNQSSRLASPFPDPRRGGADEKTTGIGGSGGEVPRERDGRGKRRPDPGWLPRVDPGRMPEPDPAGPPADPDESLDGAEALLEFLLEDSR